ncbi:MAG: hypothetical protein LBU34_13495 [Planctomycetaceae bacterium]|nr:hypothetical protein [Planctomycetaceae bacterium]
MCINVHKVGNRSPNDCVVGVPTTRNVLVGYRRRNPSAKGCLPFVGKRPPVMHILPYWLKKK